MRYTNLRKQWEDYCGKMALAGKEMLDRAGQEGRFKIQGQWYQSNPNANRDQIYAGMQEYAMAFNHLVKAKTIIFSVEQAKVFLEAEPYSEKLDYQLPFPNVLLQFSGVIRVPYKVRFEHDYDRGNLMGMILSQRAFTKQEFEDDKKRNAENRKKFQAQNKGTELIPVFNEEGKAIINSVMFLYEDRGTEYINWLATETYEHLPYDDALAGEAMNRWRRLAIACIGYTNCENVYLDQETGASKKANRKRELKRKIILEPYYVCRIRGVQYDSNGEPTGQGTHHGFRYDVRGHFRRLDSGKTTWVRPHQRGLQNELYIPKTYVVEKGAKPAA